MAISATKIDLRATHDDKNLLSRAAKSVGKSLSQFVLEVTVREAQHILADDPNIVLNAEQWDELMNRLDNPRVDKNKLKDLMNTPSVFADA